MKIDNKLKRVHRAKLPMLSRFTDMSTNKFSNTRRIKEHVGVVTCGSRAYILKKHLKSLQNRSFHRELEAYVSYDITSPHIVELVGYRVDVEDKVDAMVLNYSVECDISGYIRRRYIRDSKLKCKWVAQIVHGLMTIHEAGITHGDLRCANVVLDENLDARIIDVVQGRAMTPGWSPWKYPAMESPYEPSWDMYSLGASIWEILSHGEEPSPKEALRFDFYDTNDKGELLLRGIAERCLVDKPGDRPTADIIFNELGGTNACGCGWKVLEE